MCLALIKDKPIPILNVHRHLKLRKNQTCRFDLKYSNIDCGILVSWTLLTVYLPLSYIFILRLRIAFLFSFSFINKWSTNFYLILVHYNFFLFYFCYHFKIISDTLNNFYFIYYESQVKRFWSIVSYHSNQWLKSLYKKVFIF